MALSYSKRVRGLINPYPRTYSLTLGQVENFLIGSVYLYEQAKSGLFGRPGTTLASNGVDTCLMRRRNQRRAKYWPTFPWKEK